jgi:hypothetical protein
MVRSIVAVSVFLALVGAVLAVYLVGFGAVHPHLRLLGVPAVVGSVRMPRIGPAELVLGASVVVMIVALIALFVRDLRHSPNH